jgi:glycine/D-amino acid oxidase-like deaminating enzyme
MNELLNKKITILGAGIVGLTTALRLYELVDSKLQDKLDITIIAESFGEDTTTDGAGGLFRSI